jgi:hypothetical protein
MPWLTSVTRKFITSLFMSSFDTLTAANLASHASAEMVFLEAVGGMLPALYCSLGRSDFPQQDHCAVGAAREQEEYFDCVQPVVRAVWLYYPSVGNRVPC